MDDIERRDPQWPYPGARWWKFDFHTHTPASVDARDPDPATGGPVTPRDWLLGFMRAEIDCVAVTDHNSGEWIDKLKEALRKMEDEGAPEFRPLRLFPGVELSVNAGFHLLAIFGPEKTTSHIDNLLGAVGYKGTKGDSDGVTEESAVQVVKAVLAGGGIPIPAHADQGKGLLHLKEDGAATRIDASTVEQVLGVDGILAIETVDSGSRKPDIYRQRKLQWAEVLGSDFHPPQPSNQDSLPGSRYTWVKMASPPSIEGLRLALLDGDRFSIRRSDQQERFDPFALPEHFIESIRVRGARYMGRGQPAELKFNPSFNAIVGGRGTGKSTVVHALRLAANRERDIVDDLSEGSIPRSTFERFNRVYQRREDEGGLREDTAIEWVVMRDGVRHRVTCKPGDPSVGLEVRDQLPDGSWVDSKSPSVTSRRFPVQIYSQGHIAELTGRSRHALLRRIDEIAPDASQLQVRRKEAEEAYLASRGRVRELEAKLTREDVTIDLEDVERKLKRFEESNHAAVLKAYRASVLQEREAERQFADVEKGARRVARLADDIELESMPAGVADSGSQADAALRQVVEALTAAVDSASAELRATAAGLIEASRLQRKALDTGKWKAASDEARADHDGLLAELRAEGVSNPAEYGQLVQERQRLRREIESLRSTEEERDRLVAESAHRLKDLLEVRRSISEARESFLKRVLAHNCFVRISVRRYGDDPEVIERSFRSVLGVRDDRFESDILTHRDGKATGIVMDLLAKLPDNPSERGAKMECRVAVLKERMKSACEGRGTFGGHLNNYLERESKRDPGLLDRIWTWFPEDGLSVQYSRSGNGRDFRPISQGSAGQRSAAMLSFLMAHGTEPLVLDQPEDDLDNYLIYDLVVRQLRENKLRRQIIVVTHNPNIVVNGDAEMLHAMRFREGQCEVAEKGSLQEREVREEVCSVMEGGREAFESRYRRLGPEANDV